MIELRVRTAALIACIALSPACSTGGPAVCAGAPNGWSPRPDATGLGVVSSVATSVTRVDDTPLILGGGRSERTDATGRLELEGPGPFHIEIRAAAHLLRAVGVPPGCLRLSPDAGVGTTVGAGPPPVHGLEGLPEVAPNSRRVVELHPSRPPSALRIPGALFDPPGSICDAEGTDCTGNFTTHGLWAAAVVDVRDDGYRTLVATSSPTFEDAIDVRPVLETIAVGAPAGASEAVVGVATESSITFYGGVGSTTRVPVPDQPGELWIAWLGPPDQELQVASLLRAPYPGAVGFPLPTRHLGNQYFVADDSTSLAFLAHSGDRAHEAGWVFEGRLSDFRADATATTMDVAVLGGSADVEAPIVGVARIEIRP